ncbi:hypothetical protein Val02_44410 [Virgisporangium aliadipatigenens]|uniref:Uncharacterized protein n=1 Tax=Virgisporangium aliadipatigenens TaxID=741659 RepID=A0A8J3YPB9_9ACTN|nr:hypothetical protein [Virgisporangium aliadipatigenens]GIJ47555.1 hypothetical protein Val02_44410 [Virgisporangium aliadipatigenens]
MSALREVGAPDDGSAAVRRLGGLTRRVPWRRVLGAAGLLLVVLVLFAGYLRMSRSRPVNADGASNALQAWDMLHGNPLLSGWTVTDVSFYTTELVEYLLVELFYGLRADVVHVAAAVTYTLTVLLVAVVARGSATGREGWLRAGVGVAIVLVPSPDIGYTVVLLSPDHFGTGVPLLVTWLVLERGLRKPSRWLPYAVLVLLTWAQLGDPLAMFIGAAPLAGVCLLRMWRDRTWRGLDAHLLIAAVSSVFMTYLALVLIRLAGGFGIHPPIAKFAPLSDLLTHLRVTGEALALNFGGHFGMWDHPLGWPVALLNLCGLAVAAWAFGVALSRLVRRPANTAGDRVADVLAVAILVNLLAFVVSTQPGDLLTARQVVVVLPLGAALGGRLLGTYLHGAARPRTVPVLAGVLAVLSIGWGVSAAVATPVRPEAHQAAEWLAANGHTYGLGSYWAANTTTLYTRGKVHVAPVAGLERIAGYRWESREDWYDPARRDARFVIIDLSEAHYGTVDSALAQFGQPVTRQDFGRWAVLVYDRNLLVGLPAFCEPRPAASMAQCPYLRPRMPMSTLFFK